MSALNLLAIPRRLLPSIMLPSFPPTRSLTRTNTPTTPPPPHLKFIPTCQPLRCATHIRFRAPIHQATQSHPIWEPPRESLSVVRDWANWVAALVHDWAQGRGSMTDGNEGEVGFDLETSNAELVLFQVKECYVYMIPPRKSAASYRADEWDINKWAWEGVLKVVSKGENCSIRLEDKDTGDLYAQAPIRQDQPLPVEAVIDSSRFFVLRVEEESGGKAKHAFLGLGFRERPQAYDFQAAVFDHVKYLNKKKEAEEITQEYEAKPSADYSLKEGETLRLQLKNTTISGSGLKSKPLERTVSGSGAREPMPNPDTPENYPKRAGVPCIVPPPPPPVLQAPPSPLLKTPSMAKPSAPVSASASKGSNAAPASSDVADDLDEDFGDFQAA